MGRRGQIPESQEIKRLKGTDSAGVEAIKPRPILPTCPKYLTTLARAEWNRIVPELDRLNVLTCVDGAALEAYCNSYGNMVQAQTTLKKEGLTFTTVKGYVGQRPEVAIVNKSMLIIKAFCAEFGLTPSSRARMSIGGNTDEPDAMDKLIDG